MFGPVRCVLVGMRSHRGGYTANADVAGQDELIIGLGEVLTLSPAQRTSPIVYLPVQWNLDPAMLLVSRKK